MARLKRDASDATAFAEPMLITRWEEFFVEGGVLFVRFWCGPTPYCVAMGPAMAFKGIDRARKAMRKGAVERLTGVEGGAH